MTAQIHFPGIVTAEPWRKDAACKETDVSLFFPNQGDMVTLRAAQAVCRTCPVQQECGEFGSHEAFGVWGGLSRQEIKRSRRYRRAS